MQFTIDGKPYGQPRARAVRRGNGVAFYDPATAKAFKQRVRKAYLDVAGEHVPIPHHIPITVGIYAHFKPPSKCRKAERERLILDNAACTMRPDADNIAKAVLDALNELAYEDDAQVVSLIVWKCFDAEPRTIVTVIPDARDSQE